MVKTLVKSKTTEEVAEEPKIETMSKSQLLKMQRIENLKKARKERGKTLNREKKRFLTKKHKGAFINKSVTKRLIDKALSTSGNNMIIRENAVHVIGTGCEESVKRLYRIGSLLMNSKKKAALTRKHLEDAQKLLQL